MDTETAPPTQAAEKYTANDLMARFKAAEPPPNTVPVAQVIPETPPVVSIPSDPGEPTTPPTDPVPPVTEPVPDGAPQTEQAKYKYGELKKKAQEYDEWKASKLPEIEREKAEMKAKLEELSKVDVKSFEERLAAQQKAIEEYEQQVALNDVRSSRQFVETITNPLREIGAEIAAMAQRYEVDPVQLIEAVQTADIGERQRRIKALVENFDQYDLLGLREAERNVHKIIAQGTAMEENAYETRKELQHQEQQQKELQQQKIQQDFERASREGKKQMLEKFPWLAEDQETQAKIFGAKPAKDPMEQVFHAYAFETVPHLHKQIETQKERIKELETELSRRSNLGVKAGASQTNGAKLEAAPTPLPVGGNAMQRWQAFQASQPTT